MSKIQDNNTSLQTILNTINNLPEFGSGGIDTSDATATAEDIMLNEIAYANGKKITGSFTIDEEITTANRLIDDIDTVLNNKILGNGYELGKQAQYDEFWNTYQDNGNRTHYSYAFSGQQWGLGNIFRPKYDIKPIYADYMFSNWFSSSNSNIDLAERLKECRVVLDTSQCTSFKYFLQYGSTRHLPTIDTRSASSLANFSVNSSIWKIDKIILRDDGSQIVNNMFTASHPSLTGLTFEGVIGNTFTVSTCPNLTVDSLNNVIACLKNLTGTSTTTLTLTLGATNLAKLTDAEKAIATEKGWSLA